MNDIKVLEALERELLSQGNEDSIKANADIQGELGYLDQANVLMVVPRTTQLNGLMKQRYNGSKIPQLETGEVCKFSFEYLEHIVRILKKAEVETVTLTVKKDYPLIVEAEGLKFILAPRVSSD